MVTQEFCSSLPGREYLFRGFSEVGLIQRVTDSHSQLIAEIHFTRAVVKHIEGCVPLHSMRLCTALLY